MSSDEKKDLTQLSDYIPAPDFTGGSNEATGSSQALNTTIEFTEPSPFISDHALATPSDTTLDQIKDFANSVPIGTPDLEVSYPFSLSITGHLTAQEKEKLVDVINRESIGVREVDLDPQFEAGKILIPRISEYAGVLITQALRSAQAEIRLAPSDEIFSTEDTRQTSAPLQGPTESESFHFESPPQAELIPVTTLRELPDIPHYVVIDVVTASAVLMTRAVEAERSSEYQDLLEALSRELKYKAFRKGASAVVNFTVTITQLPNATHYRVTALGSAIKAPKN